MKQAMKIKIAGPLLILFSLVGAWSAMAHYLPQPDMAIVLKFNPPPGIEWFLEQMPRYVARPSLTALHVIPAFLFMLLAPIQLSERVRRRYPKMHRVSGRIMLLVCMSIGVSGIVIGIIMPFGGEFERVVSVSIGAIFLSTLVLGVLRARQRRYVEHRRWMLRMIATGFVPVTMRGLMISGVMLFDMSAQEIFGPTMLMGLIINFLVVEFRLRRTSHFRKVLQDDIAISAT